MFLQNSREDIDQRRAGIEHGNALELHLFRFGQPFEFDIHIVQHFEMVREKSDRLWSGSSPT